MAHSTGMDSDFEQMLANTPRSVAFRDFEGRGDIDLRRGCVDVLFVNLIGMNADSADWLPNHDPPNLNERLAWIWFLRPDLANDILEMINGDFRLLVECYRDGRMDDWWSQMIRSL